MLPPFPGHVALGGGAGWGCSRGASGGICPDRPGPCHRHLTGKNGTGQGSPGVAAKVPELGSRGCRPAGGVGPRQTGCRFLAGGVGRSGAGASPAPPTVWSTSFPAASLHPAHMALLPVPEPARPRAPGSRCPLQLQLTRDYGPPKLGGGQVWVAGGPRARAWRPPAGLGPCPPNAPAVASAKVQDPLCFCCSETFHRLLLGPRRAKTKKQTKKSQNKKQNKKRC